MEAEKVKTWLDEKETLQKGYAASLVSLNDQFHWSHTTDKITYPKRFYFILIYLISFNFIYLFPFHSPFQLFSFSLIVFLNFMSLNIFLL